MKIYKGRIKRMKTKLFGIFVCVLMIITAILPVVSSTYEDFNNQVFNEIFFDNEKIIDSLDNNIISGVNGYTEDNPNDYLINTEWGQHGRYKDKCPYTDSNHTSLCRLGCWSTAIGQIINYHSNYYSLQSVGFVDYECSDHTIDPWHILNDLDEFDYDWSQMSNKLKTGVSTEEEIDNVSRLLYDTATVIQKDFNTGGYCTVDNTTAVPKLINELREHYTSINAFTIWDNDLTEAEIVDEIDHGRPIMFYTLGHNYKNMSNITTFGHAMVIDGYNYTSVPPQIFKVHINYGWDGPTGLELPNTWYKYYGDFPTYDPDMVFDYQNYRKGLLIRLSPIFTHYSGPTAAKIGDECTFTIKSDYDTEPPLHYMFNWDDGTLSGWLGPYRLGEVCTVSYTWHTPGVYDIKVKVKNDMGSESEWSGILTIHITKYGFLMPILELLLDLRNLFPFLEHLFTPIIKLICS